MGIKTQGLVILENSRAFSRCDRNDIDRKRRVRMMFEKLATINAAWSAPQGTQCNANSRFSPLTGDMEEGVGLAQARFLASIQYANCGQFVLGFYLKCLLPAENSFS